MPRFITHWSIRPVLLAVFALLVFGPPAQAAFPGNNGKIAFVRSEGPPAFNAEIHTMNADGTGQTNVTNNPDADRDPAWSPDGTKIAFDRCSPIGEGCDVYTMNADGSGVTRLTNDPAEDFLPAWSPDGTKIVFGSSRDDPSSTEIYTMSADGSAVTRLTNNAAFDDFPAWSPDGTKIAFHSFRDDPDNAEIYTMNADGTGQTNVTNNPVHDVSPAWSPDGTKIAFGSFRDDPSPDIYTMSADGSGVTRVTNNAVYDAEPAWSPDGTKIAFESLRDPSIEVYTISAADGSAATRLTNNGGSVPDWQPIPYTGYARPKGATPFRASLVVAYTNCTTPNEQHGPPLVHPSCAPPVQESDWLTTGTADSNGQATGFTGSVRFSTLVGDPATPTDEADVAAVMNITDVRNKADLTDYTGEVEADAVLRITDRFNAAAPGGGSDPATVVDIPLPLFASCAATPDPVVGGTCAASTSMDAFVPGMVKEGQRAIWALGAIQVYDGGADGNTATQPNTLFARQGVFVP